jgi:hypothetical protein
MAAVRDESPGCLTVVATATHMVRGSGSDGPRCGDRSGFFPSRCPDDPRSGPDRLRWRSVVFFSL